MRLGPVLRFGALVVHSIAATDGPHFRMGDPVALAEIVMHACTEKGLLERLIKGISPIFPMKKMAEEHFDLYARIGTSELARRATQAKVPA